MSTVEELQKAKNYWDSTLEMIFQEMREKDEAIRLKDKALNHFSEYVSKFEAVYDSLTSEGKTMVDDYRRAKGEKSA
jgi:hypothetical protein